MTVEKSSPENTGLTFFGQVSASISHEIKNVLAVINENAGLLEDLVLMAEKGASPDVERLGRLAETVGRQVRRADGILKMMNRFAHSADLAQEPVDLYETAVFVTDLCGRMISMGHQTVTVVPPVEPVNVGTHRFYLQHLLWTCIQAMMKAGRPGGDIEICFEKTANGAMVKFCADPPPDNGALENIFSQDARSMMGYLGAQPVAGGAPGEIRVVLPADIRRRRPGGHEADNRHTGGVKV